MIWIMHLLALLFCPPVLIATILIHILMSKKQMKLKHCVPTSLLTKESYSDLICKLVTQGYTNCISQYDFELVKMWNLIGVNEYGELCLYDKPSSFLEINEWMNYLQVKDDNYPNILTKQDLEEYLK